MSVPSPTDQAAALAPRSPGQVPRPSELSSADAPETKVQSWREVVAQIAYSTGALKLFGKVSQKYEPRAGRGKLLSPLRRATQPKYVILCYHRVGTQGIPYYCTLPPVQFEMQMKFLRENFRVLSLGQVCEELNHPSGAGNGVAVTFDDGYSDLHSYALPILRKYEIPATIYLTADCIETGEVAWYDKIFLALQVAPGKSIDLSLQGGLRLELGSPAQRIENGARIVSILRRTPAAERLRFCAELEKQVNLPVEKLAGRMLTWKQVHEMRSAGIFFGSHTLSHPVLSQLPAEDVQMELRASRTLLEERLGEPVLDFAFPFGRPEDCGPAAEAAAARCGYRSAVTTTWGVNSPGTNMHALKRVQLGEERTAAKFGLHLHQAFFQPGDSAGPTAVVASGNAFRGRKETGAFAQR